MFRREQYLRNMVIHPKSIVGVADVTYLLNKKGWMMK